MEKTEIILKKVASLFGRFCYPSCSCRNFSLLSFGGEAEEEEEGDISATQALAQPALDAKERLVCHQTAGVP